MARDCRLDSFYFLYKERMSAAYARLWAKQYFGVSELIGGEFSSIFVVENGMVTAYLSKRAGELGRRYSEKFLQPSFLTKFLKRTKRLRDDFNEFYAEFKALNMPSLPDSEIANLLERFGSCFIPIAVQFNLSQEEFTQLPYLKLRDLLRDAACPDIDDAVKELLAHPVEDRLVREEKDLLRLAASGFGRDDLMHHSLAFSLMFYNSYDTKSNLDYLERRISELPSSAPKIAERARQLSHKCVAAAARQRDLEKRFGQKVARLAQLLRGIAIDRLELKEAWAGAEWRFLDLFKEVARRLAVPFNGLFSYMTLDDMDAALRGKHVDLPALAKRREFYCFYSHDGRVEEFSGADGRAFVRRRIPIALLESSPKNLTTFAS